MACAANDVLVRSSDSARDPLSGGVRPSIFGTFQNSLTSQAHFMQRLVSELLFCVWNRVLHREGFIVDLHEDYKDALKTQFSCRGAALSDVSSNQVNLKHFALNT